MGLWCCPNTAKTLYCFRTPVSSLPELYIVQVGGVRRDRMSDPREGSVLLARQCEQYEKTRRQMIEINLFKKHMWSHGVPSGDKLDASLRKNSDYVFLIHNVFLIHHGKTTFHG